MRLAELKDGKLTSGTHISFWIDSMVNPISYSPLRENLKTDVVIVGGGIAGVSIAYKLSCMNKKVVLVEDGYIGSGETGRTTAHLVSALDDRYYTLERLFGEDGAKLAAQSHGAAIDFIEQAVAHENISCDFSRVKGYLFLHPSDKNDALDKEYEAASKAGLLVKKLNRVPGMKSEESPCLEFDRQAQFHPLNYLKGLCDAIIKNGGQIYTETHARDINEKGIVTDKNFSVAAGHIVIATNSPVNNMYVMHLKQYAYRSYVIGALIKKGSVPKALWWDTGDHFTNANIPPYHYVRIQNYNSAYDMLISGGEDHATGLAKADIIPEENRYALIEDWTRRRFPVEEVVYQWSGQIMESMDELGYIGRNPWDKNNIYIVTGDSGNGMTHGTIAGILISDLIAGKENKWEKLYDPSRFKIFKAGNVFFKEFAGGFMAYLKDYPKDAKDVSLYEIKKGDASIIEMSGKKYGAYCDSDNRLHIVSAECTHLKCIVKWNPDEKSWDCPCHGSRFTYEGKVINGPANTDLKYHAAESEETLSKIEGKTG